MSYISQALYVIGRDRISDASQTENNRAAGVASHHQQQQAIHLRSLHPIYNTY